MFRVILQRELHEALKGYTFKSVIVLLTLLVPLSAYIQAVHYRRLVEDYASRQNIHRVESRNEIVVLTRPVPSLLPFFNGVYENRPNEFRLQRDSALVLPSSEDLAPLEWLFPKVDLSFIIGVLLTLMSILIAYDKIAGEKARGTLKFVLSFPLSRRSVLLAKLTGTTLQLLVPLIYAVFLYTIVLIFFSYKEMTTLTVSWAELGALVLTALIVLMVFALLNMAISTTVKQSSTVMVACTPVWTAVVLLWPSLGLYAASSLRPIAVQEATQHQITLKEAELIQAELADHKEVAAGLQTQKAGVEVAWERYIELRRRWMGRRNDEVKQLTDERRRQINGRQQLARSIVRLSPYGALKDILGSLCNTGPDSYEDFLDAVELYYQQEFLPASMAHLARHKPGLNNTNQNDELQLRPFQVPSPSLGARLKQAALSLCLLLGQIFGLLAVCLFRFDHYDVR